MLPIIFVISIILGAKLLYYYSRTIYRLSKRFFYRYQLGRFQVLFFMLQNDLYIIFME